MTEPGVDRFDSYHDTRMLECSNFRNEYLSSICPDARCCLDRLLYFHVGSDTDGTDSVKSDQTVTVSISRDHENGGLWSFVCWRCPNFQKCLLQ